VLSELVLGQDPAPDTAQALQAELGSLCLEEALTEVVYQVQEKLSQAAAVAEAAEAAAAAAAERQQQQRAPLAAGSRASSLRMNSPRVSERLLARHACCINLVRKLINTSRTAASLRPGCMPSHERGNPDVVRICAAAAAACR
jgi:hypothetical protein